MREDRMSKEEKLPDPMLMKLSDELVRLRDVMVEMSGALRELQFKLPSQDKAEISDEVERYLAKIKELGM